MNQLLLLFMIGGLSIDVRLSENKVFFEFFLDYMDLICTVYTWFTLWFTLVYTWQQISSDCREQCLFFTVEDYLLMDS